MSYGINYKYNGLLHHNIHRLWIITKVVVPKLNDVKFPDINFDPDCDFLKQLKYTHVASKHVNSIREYMSINEATDHFTETKGIVL